MSSTLTAPAILAEGNGWAEPLAEYLIPDILDAVGSASEAATHNEIVTRFDAEMAAKLSPAAQKVVWREFQNGEFRTLTATVVHFAELGCLTASQTSQTKK